MQFKKGDGLEEINMVNSRIKLVQNDPQLINKMKQIIDSQQIQLDKKTQLLLAIQNNIQYLNNLHNQNELEVQDTREKFIQIYKENEKLIEKNHELMLANDVLQRDSERLVKEQQRIALLVQAQENQRITIQTLENQIGQQSDKVQKLDFDLTVIFTEKQAFKKELEQQDEEIRELKNELNELQTKYNLVTDENTKNLLQNSEYRELILGNENAMKQYREELKETQAKVDIRDQHIRNLKTEIEGLKNQINNLIKELKGAKDEQDNLREENVKLMAGEALIVTDEQLKAKFLTLQNDFEFKKKEWAANEERMTAQLNFSKDANENLKKDYDLLQEKFENYMRSNDQLTNSIKTELDDYKQKNKILKFQLDDIKAELETKIKEANEQAEVEKKIAKEEVKKKDEELQKVKNELDQIKGDLNLKLTRLKLMEIELYRQNQDNLERQQMSKMSQYSKKSQIIQQEQEDLQLQDDNTHDNDKT